MGTSGSEGGPGKQAGSNSGTALRLDPDFNLRRYPNGKLLIKPGTTAIKRFRDRLAKEFRALRGSNVAAVLAAITPIIRGWVAYYRTVGSLSVFHSLTEDHWNWPTSGHAGATGTSPGTGSSTGISGSSTSSGMTGGYSATGTPAPTCPNRPGPILCGTPWSKAGHPRMTPPWPITGTNVARRSNPRWTPPPCTCSPGRTDGAAYAENLLTPDQPPQSPQGWERWFLQVIRPRSRRTTWSTTTRPMPHATSEHTSYTPPATGADNRPGRWETP